MVRLLSLALSISAFCGVLMLRHSVSAQEVVRILAEDAQLQLLRKVPISTEVAGKLTTVNPTQEGTLVKKDDLLIKVNDSVILGEVAHAKAQAEQTTEIEFAQKSKESAEFRLKTMTDANIRAEGAFNQNEIHQQELEVEKAHAQLSKSNDDKLLYGLTLEIKTATLAQYEVKAPFDGLVTQVHKYPGQSVRPGDPVLTITDMSELRAALKVNFKHRDSLFVGDAVEIRINTAQKAGNAEETPFGTEPKRDAGDFFNRKGPNSEPAPEPAGEALSDETDGKVFIGEIKFIEATIERNTGAYFVLLSVLVPNHQDEYGRYMLQEGLPVEAVVLARKRAE